MRTFTHDWLPDALSAKWLELVVPSLGERVRWLELGSHEGRSACWVIDNVFKEKQGALVCVDHWVSAAAESLFDKNTAGKAVKVKEKTASFLAKHLAFGSKFDVIYIDADHEARSVLEDAVLSWNLLPVGGIGIFDDYRWQMPAEKSHLLPPKPAIDAFLSIYGSCISVLHKDHQVIFRRTR